MALADGEDVREHLDRVGALRHVGPDHFFKSAARALDAFRKSVAFS